MSDNMQGLVTIVTLLTPVALGVLAYLTLRLNSKQTELKTAVVGVADRQHDAAVKREDTDKKVAEVSAKIDVIKHATDGMKDAIVTATDRMARAEGKAEGKAEERAEGKADAEKASNPGSTR